MYFTPDHYLTFIINMFALKLFPKKSACIKLSFSLSICFITHCTWQFDLICHSLLSQWVLNLKILYFGILAMVTTVFRKWIIHRSYKTIQAWLFPIYMLWTMWILFFLLVGITEVIAYLEYIQKSILYFKTINREFPKWAE